jgi:hypothetical protein
LILWKVSKTHTYKAAGTHQLGLLLSGGARATTETQSVTVTLNAAPIPTIPAGMSFQCLAILILTSMLILGGLLGLKQNLEDIDIKGNKTKNIVL